MRRNRSRIWPSSNRHFVERGIVGVGDLLATMVPQPLQTFRAAERPGWASSARCTTRWAAISSGEVPDLTDDDRTGRMKIAGLKLFMDGAYSNRTAWTEDAVPGFVRPRHAHPHRRRPA